VEARGVIHRIAKETSEYGVSFQEINQEDVAYIETLVKKEKKNR